VTLPSNLTTARKDTPGVVPACVGQTKAVEAALAVAEGAVPGLAPEAVAFHEVGAVDSTVDLVGSCVALESLEVDSVSCGPLPLGSGVVSSRHGPLPAPGTATLEVLKGSRVRWLDEPHEMTTPTGAALMSALTGGFFSDDAPPMTLRAVGYGAGLARFEARPNLLRAVLGELEGSVGDVELIEANIDDASGEIFGAAVERLLGAGALDAWLEPVLMKRGRGAYKVCLLVNGLDRDLLARLLMRETGTLGVRHHPVGRTVAERRLVEVYPTGAAGSRSGAWTARTSPSSPSTPTPHGSPSSPVSPCRASTPTPAPPTRHVPRDRSVRETTRAAREGIDLRNAPQVTIYAARSSSG
jgi:uncharacterized protein (TIGR00299 family) protein